MLPNVTSTNATTGVEPYKSGTFDAYITYCALGGIITEDDGDTHRMSIDEFCRNYNVSRMTLSRWKKQTSDWKERVDKRRDEIVPLARVTAVWNNLYLIARQQKDKRAAVEAAKAFLGHHGLQLPTQRVEAKVEINSWTGLMEAKRNVIEGEVVDGTTTAAAD